MPTNIAKQIAEELLADNLVLQNEVRIICRNNLAPGQAIQGPAYAAIGRIPKAEYWQVASSIKEYDLINMFKQTSPSIFLPQASGGTIIVTLLAVAIMKEMKQLVLSSAPV